MKPGDLVLVVRLPKYWGGPDIRGSWGTVLEQGMHENRWIILVDNRRFSFHSNHLKGVEDVGTQSR
jgi:hypothetical protein